MINTTLSIQLKRLGKKKIKTLDFAIEKQPNTLKQLIQECVNAEVKKYNNNVPPYRETENYIKRVKILQKRYK